MNFSISKPTLYQFLYALCVLVLFLKSYEITFGVWLFTAFITFRLKYSFSFFKFLMAFVTIILIAFVVGLFRDPLLKDVLKDITMLLKPILGLVIGYQIIKNNQVNTRTFFKIIIYTGLLSALIHLGILAYSFAFENIRTVHKLRHFGGYFNDYETYIFVILLFYKEFKIDITRKQFYIFSSILFISVLFYFARTNFLQILILYLALKGYFVLNKRSVIVLASIAILGGLAYTGIYYYNPSRGATGIEGFLYKVKVAPTEPFKTHVNSAYWKDFHDNYRSYENILTVRQVTRQGTETVLFGEGLGSFLDLKRKVWLHTSSMQYIPFLHNCFMTVFLKSGILGLCIYFYTIYFFFKRRESIDSEDKQINLLLLGTGFFMILSSWVFLGLYNQIDAKSILIGAFLAYKENKQASKTLN